MTFASGLEDLRVQVPFLSLSAHVPQRGASLLVRPIAPGVMMYTQWIDAYSDSGASVVIPYRAVNQFASRPDANKGTYGESKVTREYLIYVRGVESSLLATDEEESSGEEATPEDDAMVLTLTMSRATMVREYLARSGSTLADTMFRFSRIMSGKDKGKYLFAVLPATSSLSAEDLSAHPIYTDQLMSLAQDRSPQPTPTIESAIESVTQSFPGVAALPQRAIAPTVQYNYLLTQLLTILSAYDYEEQAIISSIHRRGIGLDITVIEFQSLLQDAIQLWANKADPGIGDTTDMVDAIDWDRDDWANQLLSTGSLISPFSN
jgi:hypothetical protein